MYKIISASVKIKGEQVTAATVILLSKMERFDLIPGVVTVFTSKHSDGDMVYTTCKQSSDVRDVTTSLYEINDHIPYDVAKVLDCSRYEGDLLRIEHLDLEATFGNTLFSTEHSGKACVPIFENRVKLNLYTEDKALSPVKMPRDCVIELKEPGKYGFDIDGYLRENLLCYIAKYGDDTGGVLRTDYLLPLCEATSQVRGTTLRIAKVRDGNILIDSGDFKTKYPTHESKFDEHKLLNHLDWLTGVRSALPDNCIDTKTSTKAIYNSLVEEDEFLHSSSKPYGIMLLDEHNPMPAIHDAFNLDKVEFDYNVYPDLVIKEVSGTDSLVYFERWTLPSSEMDLNFSYLRYSKAGGSLRGMTKAHVFYDSYPWSYSNSYSPDDKRVKFEVWLEGYSATGQHSTAKLVDTVLAMSLNDAINRLVISGKLDESYMNRNGIEYRYWGCRFFDNETDARKSFG